ncbi:site-specific integrase [Treponema primitia]|uniref:site-specific integrase n=1 Tax=Treponema primitia TaxID=88058 RepID=UPI000255584B|nr:site-specific integrase [Treponema primitia]
MGVKIRQKRQKLYLDIYVNGSRKWESLKLTLTGDPDQDKDILRKAKYARSVREGQLFDGQWGLQDQTGAKKTLFKFIEKMGEGRDKKKDRICKVLPYLEKYPGGISIQIGQVNAKWFTNFQNYLVKDSGLNETSANSYAFAVRMALAQAVRENVLVSNPAEGIKSIAVPEPDREFLSLAEVQKLFKTPINGKLGEDVKRAFLFSCYCGLRVSDLKSLSWGDIERTQSGAQIVKRQIKTKKRVIIPLHNSAWALINDNQIHHHSEPVFPLLAAVKSDTNRNLVPWTQKAGIEKKITWHAARRSAASLLHEMGVDVYTIQKLLGHAKVSTTALYTAVSDQSLRKAIDSLPPIEILEGNK